jgi:hypothetical protein
MTRSRARQVEETYSGASKRSLNYVDSEVTVIQRFEAHSSGDSALTEAM